MKHVICHYCKKKVKDRDELVTASNWFRIKPFHYKCFKEQEQEITVSINAWNPVNGPAGNLSFIIMFVLAVWMLFTDTLGMIGDLIGLVALYPVFLRILSFVLIELTLPKISTRKKR
ncbi:hypothetical protein GCM10007216_36940 [Thalassobacillus devorans]|uniref:Uncharacterized protein n=1 Tax=Thalassobacillus devorans TaxID=279813 RepID=A0ABQ1PSC8_9BACI|nr:hypothetical protein [Thalassobacillus devorans]NIK30664.1 hypothetical protein [Thalassobacillus devorans]GGD02764.1 hypothetical protein GCM10007216_36940 [Thalassobacillus devorans]